MKLPPLDAYLHTLRYVRPRQLAGRLPRPFARFRLAPVGPAVARPAGGPWVRPIARPRAETGPRRFRFLNDERTIETWNDRGIPRLWLYNLHYCDCPDAALILSWIGQNPMGHGTGWEPYPLSLRIANWIKWALDGNELPDGALASLANQARYLSRHLEYRLMANHLFANAKALVFAGAFFSGGEAGGWLRKGIALLEEQAAEQILDDGGHFERSPMYHSLVLEDLLDLVNLGNRYAGLLPDWRMGAARMLGWLEQMLHADGDIAFFNDAAFGVAATPAVLRAYAARLGIGGAAASLAQSGYIRLASGPTLLVFDAAPIGPDYQPGHAHADTLSFELSHAAERLLVNSGTSTYEAGAVRQQQRGTAAHNTVRLDGLDQSEMWGAFRVARRARPFDVRSDGHSYAEAAHDGYTRLGAPAVHRRRIDLLAPGRIRIADRVEGAGRHRVEVFFHQYPGARVGIQLDPQLTRRDQATAFHPQFGLSVANQTVTGEWSGQCPAAFTHEIDLSIA